MGGIEFSTNTLACVLGAHGAIDLTDEEENAPEGSSNKGVNSIKIRKGGGSKFGYDGDDI